MKDGQVLAGTIKSNEWMTPTEWMAGMDTEKMAKALEKMCDECGCRTNAEKRVQVYFYFGMYSVSGVIKDAMGANGIHDGTETDHGEIVGQGAIDW